MQPEHSVRPIARSDASQLHTLFVDSQLEPILGFEPTLADIDRHVFGDADYQPNLVLGIYDGARLLGAVSGVRRLWKKGKEHVGYVKWVLVHPSARRRGLGRALLDACQAALRKPTCPPQANGAGRHGATELMYGSSAPTYLLPGVPEADTGQRAFFHASGWTEGSRRTSLVATLPESIDAPVPEGYTFAPAGAEDEGAVRAFIESSFSRSWAIESGPALQDANKAFVSLARENRTREIKGFAAVHATNPNWFGPMGVEESLQGQGLGLALLAHALQEAAARGTQHLIFPWVNDAARFYRRLLPAARTLHFLKCGNDCIPSFDEV